MASCLRQLRREAHGHPAPSERDKAKARPRPATLILGLTAVTFLVALLVRALTDLFAAG